MSPPEDREAEVELLKSMFQLGSELSFDDDCDCIGRSIHEVLDYTSRATQIINFSIKLPEHAEMSVQLPPGYPSGDLNDPVKPIITLRMLPEALARGVRERQLSSEFSQWLDETAASGEPVICLAVDWLRERLESEFRKSDMRPHSDDVQTSCTQFDSPVVCIWIVSHHIRSPVKRRLILEWAGELKLGGCCMPGRPGLIVAEGREHNVDEYWRRLRALQWKHIQLRDREQLLLASYTTRRFADGFHEIFLSQHSRFQWLHDRGVSSDQFKLVFGIPGRLPQS